MAASDTPTTNPMRNFRKTQGRETPAVAMAERMMSTATQTSSIHRRIADQIGTAILCGQRAAGSLLPKEMEASADLGVSRSAYREAVRMLIAKGLVESRPKIGTHVTNRRRWQVLDPDVLRWAFHSGPSVAFIQELFELRGILEPHAAELAARRRNVDHLTLMGHALAEMGRYGLGTDEGRAADQRFHEEILVATGNQALIALSASIGAAIHWTTVFKYRSANAPRDAMPDHRKLYAAIVDSDAAGAAQAARELLQLALQDTRASLGAEIEETGAKRMARKAR
jgi:DNA-binding FadR family transcriptional regulator